MCLNMHQSIERGFGAKGKLWLLKLIFARAAVDEFFLVTEFLVPLWSINCNLEDFTHRNKHFLLKTFLYLFVFVFTFVFVFVFVFVFAFVFVKGVRRTNLVLFWADNIKEWRNTELKYMKYWRYSIFMKIGSCGV